MKKWNLLLLILLLFIQNGFAQEETSTVEMADQLRADGKIYVVVGVLLVILIGLFFYLIRLDGKIGRIEKESRR
jgi:uncharacterized membrane protein